MSLPIIRGSSQGLYPLRLTISFLTGVGDWQNGAQQRWVRQPGARIKAELLYAAMTQAQKNTLKAAVTSAKGRFDNTLSATLPFNGALTSFTNMGIDADVWEAIEATSMQYNGPIRLTQAITQNLSPGSPGGAFPTLSSGAIAILPYTERKRFQTVFQRVETGPAYAFAEFAGGLSGYPSDGLPGFGSDMQHVKDADVATLTAHYLANWGRAYAFTFTDEAGNPYSNTHYASDDLTITYNGPNDAALTIDLEVDF